MNIDLSKIDNIVVREIISAIISEKVIERHIISHTWFSGSVTEVYPFMVWKRNIDVYVDTNAKKHYQSAIDRVLAKYPNLFESGYFCKSDGSTPSYICFNYTEDTINSL